MAVILRELGKQRFVGDTESMLVHDRWHGGCEDCLMEELIQRGVARGFAPDESDQAFWEDYEYCPYCFDRIDPKPPAWALTGLDEESASGSGEGSAGMESQRATARVSGDVSTDE
ncbi:hypothetical protein K8S17_04795 [bacterium]|nr:hypothetical protein [bacterium]